MKTPKDFEKLIVEGYKTINEIRTAEHTPQTGKVETVPDGATCHYERDKDGLWWVVWAGDFYTDKGGSKLCPTSASMEMAYQQGRCELIEEMEKPCPHKLDEPCLACIRARWQEFKYDATQKGGR